MGPDLLSDTFRCLNSIFSHSIFLKKRAGVKPRICLIFSKIWTQTHKWIILIIIIIILICLIFHFSRNFSGIAMPLCPRKCVWEFFFNYRPNYLSSTTEQTKVHMSAQVQVSRTNLQTCLLAGCVNWWLFWAFPAGLLLTQKRIVGRI